MGLWLLFSILLIVIFIILRFLFRQKEKKHEYLIKTHKVQLKAKDSELQEKNSELQEKELELQEKDNTYKTKIFTYLKYEGMPPDNNEAERDLRPFVVQRKRSGGFKSPEVMWHYVIYLSLYMTCKLNVKNFDKLLDLIFSGMEFNLGSFLFC